MVVSWSPFPSESLSLCMWGTAAAVSWEQIWVLYVCRTWSSDLYGDVRCVGVATCAKRAVTSAFSASSVPKGGGIGPPCPPRIRPWADTCMLYPLVFNCRGVPSLWLLLGCLRIVLKRILYSLFIDERGIYHYLLQLTKCKHFILCELWSRWTFNCNMFMWMCCCQKV